MQFEVTLSHGGAGDAFAACWVLEGLKNAGFDPVIFAPGKLLDAFQLAAPGRAKLMQSRVRDLAQFAHYSTQLHAQGISRISAMAMATGKRITPAPPKLDIKPDPRTAGKWLFLPDSWHPARWWPQSHWQDLAEDSPPHIVAAMPGRWNAMRNRVEVKDWQTMAGLILGAKGVLCVDSGPFHLACLLGHPRVVLLHAKEPARAFQEYNFESVFPPPWQPECGIPPRRSIGRPGPPDYPTGCRGCSGIPSRGWLPKCRQKCGEMAAITPRRVRFLLDY